MLQQNQQEVRDALEELELSLQTPLVPGELENWIRAVETACQATGDVLQRQIAVVHRQQFAEMLQQDPGMQPRVDELQAGDEKTQEMFASFRDRVERLAPKVLAVDADEGRVEERLKALSEQGLEFVGHARSQETATNTWFMEAFNRERGGGD